MATTLDLLVNFRGSDAQQGIANLNRDLNQQRENLKRLSAEEAARSAKSRASLAVLSAEEKKRSLSLQSSATQVRQFQLAQERSAAAQARAAIAQQKLSLLTGQQAQGGISGFQKILGILETRMPYSISRTGSLFGQAFGGATSGVGLLAGAIGVGLVGALGLAASAATLFGKQFQSALEVSESVIGNSTAIAREFGISRTEASKTVIENQKLIEQLGRDLPTSIADISQALSLAQNSGIARLAEGDLGLYQRDVLGTTDRLGIIPLAGIVKQQLGSTITDIQYQQAIGAISNPNAKLSDLNRLEFVRASGLGTELEKRNFDAARSGVERLKIYLDAFTAIVPPEAIAEQKQTVSALVSSFFDRLFAPRTGIFGFLKDVDPLIEGDQTVFDEAKRTINLLIGDSGTFTQMGRLLAGTGDPLLELRNNIRSFNEFLERLNDFLRTLSDLKENIQDPQKTAENILKLNARAPQTSLDLLTLLSPTNPIFGAIGQIQKYASLGQPKAQPKYMGSPELFARPAASGFMPLGSAIATELANKPAGTNLVIGNTSEAVITPKQMGALGRSQSSKSFTIAPGAITINASPGMNEGDIADKVVAAIDRLFKWELSGLIEG